MTQGSAMDESLKHTFTRVVLLWGVFPAPRDLSALLTPDVPATSLSSLAPAASSSAAVGLCTLAASAPPRCHCG